MVDAIKAESRTEAQQEGVQQGRQQERDRIAAIISADTAKGREQLAQHLAFATDMAADMALATLDAAPVKPEAAHPVSVTGFEQAMATVNNPAIEPDDGEHEEDNTDSVAKRIAQFSKGGAA